MSQGAGETNLRPSTSSPGRFSLAFPAPPPKPGKRALGTKLYAPQFEGTEVANFRKLVLTTLNLKYAVYSDFSLEIPKLKSLGELKQRVMDVTMFNIGQLASMMGFAWSGGCFAKYSGDDFRRSGDKWESTYR